MTPLLSVILRTKQEQNQMLAHAEALLILKRQLHIPYDVAIFMPLANIRGTYATRLGKKSK